MSSSLLLDVSIINKLATTPINAVDANIKNTATIPCAVAIKPTTVGATAEANLSQEVASPVPIALIRVG